MKVILIFCLLALGSSVAEEASSTASSLEVSTENENTSLESSTDSRITTPEEQRLIDFTTKEATLPSSTIYPSTADPEDTSVTSSAPEISTTEFDEQNEEDVVQDEDDEEADDEDEEDEHVDDSKEHLRTTESNDVNVNNPLALVGDNTTSATTAASPALPRPPSFTAGSFFIGLLLGLVLLAVAYFGYVYYQRRKSLPTAGYRNTLQATEPSYISPHWTSQELFNR